MHKNVPVPEEVQTQKLFGFYRAVVEDNDDPEKAGRARVRVFGLHTHVKTKTETEGIPTDELPWAEPCFPIVEGSISGFGMWSVPVQGSHVMVFFENGNIFQPRYFASMPGIPESKNSFQVADESQSQKDGFRDPDGVYPKGDRLGEPDVNRLARGVKADTLVIIKEDNLDKSVDIAGGGSFDEPNPSYNARYPENFVFSTHGGLTVELDSTPGAKRFHIYHPSNTYIECDNDGTLVIRNQKERYDIVLEDRYIHIKQDNIRTVDGDEKIKVDGDKTIEIDGERDTDIGNDDTLDVGGNLTITVTGNVIITAPSTTITGGTVALAAQGAQSGLANSSFITLYNQHKHSIAGPPPIPADQAGPSDLTSNVTGS